jgi:hypothetical protein
MAMRFDLGSCPGARHNGALARITLTLPLRGLGEEVVNQKKSPAFAGLFEAEKTEREQNRIKRFPLLQTPAISSGRLPA